MTGDDAGEKGYAIKLGAWIRSIRHQKQLSFQDNGRMLTIRHDDLPTVACILDCHPEQVPARLGSLGLLLVP